MLVSANITDLESHKEPFSRFSTFTEIKSLLGDFPGGSVVKNPPVNAGDTGLIPGLGRSHMPWSN